MVNLIIFQILLQKKEFNKMRKINPNAKIEFLSPKNLGHKLDIKIFLKILNNE